MVRSEEGDESKKEGPWWMGGPIQDRIVGSPPTEMYHILRRKRHE